MMRQLALLILLMLAIIAPGQVKERLIAPGDTVHVTCEEEASLNGPYKITRDGLIVMKFVGAIKVSGLKAPEAALKIRDQLLLHRVLTQATITLAFSEEPPVSKPVRFEGAVKLASEVPFKEKMRLADLVKLAEPTVSANLAAIEIIGENLKRQTYEFPKENPELKPGDVVFFPMLLTRSGTIAVLGGVVKPGVQTWQDGLTVRLAIKAAGGFDGLGNSSRVRLEREKQQPRNLDLTLEEADEKLEPGDRVVVELNPVRRFVFISGQVHKLGSLEFVDGMTLTQAIQKAGGLIPESKVKEVKIFESGQRGNGKLKGTYNLERILQGYVGDVKLVPGDRIEVGRVTRRR